MDRGQVRFLLFALGRSLFTPPRTEPMNDDTDNHDELDDLEIEKLLTEGPCAEGSVKINRGRTTAEVQYRIQLLPPGRIQQIKIERILYLRELGIEECTPATAELFDQELRLRILAEAVRKRKSNQPLASLERWRKVIGPAAEHCMRHYTELEALSEPTDMELAVLLPRLEEYVKKNEGPGSAEFWTTIDYETLLACFTSLALRPVVCPTCSSPDTHSG